MERNPQQLHNKEYDILVIGGGIYGACVCWDAASRGLSTALIEKNDFSSATSASSLKVIHGGLRYLQTGNVFLMQLMKREQRHWMRIAPHLIHSIPCWVPTYNKLSRSKPAFGFAVTINNCVDWYGNLFAVLGNKLEFGRIVSKDDMTDVFPGIRFDRVTGGSTWSEACIGNPARLVISMLHSAAISGAEIANYVEASSLLIKEGSVFGVKAKDRLTGQEFEIRAKQTINCTGGWVDDLLRGLEGRKEHRWFNRSIAFNIVTHKLIERNGLMGFSSYPSNKHEDQKTLGPLLFALNWGNHTLLGTKHIFEQATSLGYPVPESQVQKFLNEINSGYPEAALTLDDIDDILWGYLPMVYQTQTGKEVKLVRDIQIIDHEKTENIPGLLTVIGVRYTLARYIAARTIDLAFSKLHKTHVKSQTTTTPIYGGEFDNFTDLLMNSTPDLSFTDEQTAKRLLLSYGANYSDILNIANQDGNLKNKIAGVQPTLGAEIIHAVRNEMAMTIPDVLRRRTELAPFGCVKEETIRDCAMIMASELAWDDSQIQSAVDLARAEMNAGWRN